jgi:hypothetical protein
MSFNEILPFSIHHLSFLQFLYIGTVWLLFLIFQKFKLSTIGLTFIDKRGRKASYDHSEKTCKDLNFTRSFQDVQECKCSCSWSTTCYHSYYIYAWRLLMNWCVHSSDDEPNFDPKRSYS